MKAPLTILEQGVAGSVAALLCPAERIQSPRPGKPGAMTAEVLRDFGKADVQKGSPLRAALFCLVGGAGRTGRQAGGRRPEQRITQVDHVDLQT